MPTLVPASIPAAAPPQAAKVAAFDMTAVRREFKGFKYRSYLFEKKKREVLAALEKLRKKQASLKTSLAAEIDVDARRELARQIEKLGNIETEEVRIKKMLDKEAAKLDEACYNEIKMVVEKMAEMNGYDIVLAYPGPEKASDAEVGSIGTGVYHFRANAKRAANSNEENAHLANTRHLRLQLHPPAAQPFHIAKKVETTGVVVQTLNTWYPPKDATGQPVNVDLLPELP
jgi:Skp family chaperone for outer membrane proteins